MRTWLLLGFALACGGPVFAADPASKSGILDQLAEEEKWKFQPKSDRPDILIDTLVELQLDKQLQSARESESRNVDRIPGMPVDLEGGQPSTKAQLDELLKVAQQEERRVQSLVASHKWDEAIRAADAAIRLITPQAERAEIRTLLASIRSFREQAEDAKIRDEAQVAFDALGLRIQGIMWSESDAKSRLVIIDGEPRALAVNDRVKDCVVINIDSDRVDFRYHFKRKRFEFPRYVGEHTASK